MDRYILPYGGLPAGPPDRGPAEPSPAPPAIGPSGVPGIPSSFGPGHGGGKGPSDYLRALRRRFWLMLLVAGVLGASGTILVLRLPPVYRASAQIEIVPPQVDTILAGLIGDEEINLTPVTAEQYESNRLADLRNRQIVESVLRSPRLGPPMRSDGDPAEELIARLKTNRVGLSTHYDVHLEGNDPHQVARILDLWLEEYEALARKEVEDHVLDSKDAAEANLKTLERELDEFDRQIIDAMAAEPNLSPDGENYQIRYLESLGQMKLRKQDSIDQLHHQIWISRMFPKERTPSFAAQEREIAELMERRRELNLRIGEIARISRNPGDPALNRYRQMLRELDWQIQSLQEESLAAQTPTADPALSYFPQYVELLSGQLSEIEEQEALAYGKIRQMAPAHSRFNTLLKERERTAAAKADLRDKIDQFDVLARTQNSPVKVVQRPIAPTKPVSPNYTILLALVTFASLGSGAGLVVLLEHLDHSVRGPEQLTTGLTLPLLGVVPRMKRTARLQRGGHLWTAGAPLSAEADAYRNLRASLVGLAGPEGRPAVTLLVTSAKAGEGKSTTALNLAATCARSGERTLLLEVDLRRPSLRPVFDEEEHDLGLVDVLRGEMPWQRTVLRTDLPNLDFLPAGDPSGVPIEILGALEMKQLVAAVSGHYDRVILDGPAILGLADCRMLGRVVDSALLVVRAGANDLRPVLRARAMLEQSRAPIIGVVFNGLCEDVNNWSCVASYLDPDADRVSSALSDRPRRAAGALASAN
ncbi:polysaccharide biosynthesis tyrosine autokinase [Tautonia sociabilis]|uniref:Polysaccharide biosynthesis tyrosine autokinase n=1 Tax=Tautonia sociabilis TaxID=2080755 RepID=A0A432MLS3_9BACT|nr:polysaccharide biosynthesis tyrosine autokinase [Tautonia sociabilis]RUL88157.1 polysaccharide biosynthesis tyrosine autokinase [Tautonia sociabilis]